MKHSINQERQQHINEGYESLAITGGNELNGTVSVQGSKNATLPILSALPLLEKATIYNVPEITDVFDMIEILEYIGLDITFENGTITSINRGIENNSIPEDFTSRIRASSLFMGPLLSLSSEVTIGVPGGCSIGSRPLDIHIDGFERLGSESEINYGHYQIKGRPKSGEYTLPFPSVGATQNLISYSVLGKETVVLHNVAIEPEILDFVNFLEAAGADITVHPTKKIIINGVDKLKEVEYSVQPDRIEAFTLLSAGLATKGKIKLVDCVPEHLSLPLQYLALMGANIFTGRDYIIAEYVQPLKGIKLETSVYPGFPTDCQQLISILMLTASTSSLITENVFNNRFSHLDEAIKMNADVEYKDSVAFIKPSLLTSSSVSPQDLRGAASLIVSALAANGTSYVDNIKDLNRGYERLVEKLQYLGADITKV